MKVVPICAESFGANTYLVVSGTHALVVDPAVSVGAILNAVRAEDAFLEGILLTHGHFDHILSLDTLRDALPISARIHQADAVMLTDGRKNAFYDFFGKERVYRPAEELLSRRQTISLGDESITVLHTPGHTPGSVCYLCGDSLLTGDTLFAESYGRCDLWGGSQEQMQVSLASLRSLSPALTIYPGHGVSARLSFALDNVSYFL
ncbi:MAG: MBL fold metallo-hydrolase [Clostridia bacterium]|nr:MBL fold metallo-hydrolase [Clostridia bacterium]